MIALWIILGLVSLITFLLLFSLTIYIKITDEVEMMIGAFGYKKCIDFEEKEEQPQKKEQKKPNKAKEATQNVSKKKANEKSFSETLEFSITLIKSIVPKSVALLKHIRITNVLIDIVVASEFADETAINYGLQSAGLYTLLGFLNNSFKLQVKSVDILANFDIKKSIYDISFKVKIRFIHILTAIVGILISFIVNTMKYKKESGGVK